jgi:hypothetical protein
MPVSQDTGILFARYIQGEDRSQSALFPLSLDELIPDDHLVRVIEACISLLDFEQLGFDKARPKATGRPSYDPADLLKLYLYGYFQRIRSSRRLEAECQRHLPRLCSVLPTRRPDCWRAAVISLAMLMKPLSSGWSCECRPAPR